MLFDQLTSAGNTMKPHFRDSKMERCDSPLVDLLFSSTSKVSNRKNHPSHRNSGYVPSVRVPLYSRLPSCRKPHCHDNIYETISASFSWTLD